MSASSVMLLCFVLLVSVHRRPPPRLPPPPLKPPPPPLKPPPPRLKPPPPREPKLDEPRLLCERALEPLNLSEPPNAESLPLARGTSRCPMRSPPTPAARLLEYAPARSRAAAPAWPVTPDVPT